MNAATQAPASSAPSFQIHTTCGGVLLQRDDESDVCFIGRRHIGSPLGMPKIAKQFASAADAQAFVAKHKVRNVRIVPAPAHCELCSDEGVVSDDGVTLAPCPSCKGTSPSSVSESKR